jgi:hypothetical protein
MIFGSVSRTAPLRIRRAVADLKTVNSIIYKTNFRILPWAFGNFFSWIGAVTPQGPKVDLDNSNYCAKGFFHGKGGGEGIGPVSLQHNRIIRF